MRSIAVFTILLFACPNLAKSQIDFEKMRKQYEKRFDFLDSMTGSPSDFGLQYEDIQAKTSDGISISAWFISVPKSRYTLLMVHGFMMNKSHMLSRSKFYADAGFSVLMMDLRARGKSDGKVTGGMGAGNVPDIEAIAQHYSNNYSDYGKLVAYGFSHGGRALIHEHRLLVLKK